MVSIRSLLLFLICFLGLAWQRCVAGELPQLDVFTAGMQRHGGFFDAYWDDSEGKLLLKIDRFGEDFLLLSALESGLGSNPVGLDRGQLGDSIVCRWRKVGRRVFLEQQNLKFRAEGAAESERRAVADSFAPSILWSGDVVAVDGKQVVTDVTSLVVSDRHSISNTLEASEQGSYSLNSERSFPLPESLRAFPDNLDLVAMLTFSSGNAGGQVRSVAANGQAFSIRQRLSFIRLPGPGFQRRPFDPRIGAFDVAYADYAVPLSQSIFKSLMVRHRLQLDDEGNVVEPIVYYVDAAAPEPVRSALVEGASWWTQAFEAAGFPGGFKVEVAPDGMDPLDIRFNFIQWVHRQTRGWSYGSSVIDPRSGEIIKGHVSLGSLRVRQDRLLTENLFAENLQKGSSSSTGAACGMSFPASLLALDNLSGRQQAIEVSLARIRQLAAHEVGHTLGIAHNFAASTYSDRASVMDYPAPRISINEDGKIDASDAYAVGMGAWDMRTIDYMYREFPDVSQWKAYVSEKLAADIREGIIYISDSDARPLGGAHPKAHLWDNGEDPISELENVLKVRQVAIQKFGPHVLLDGEPQGELVRAFAPLYFYHRYQAEAVVKLIGGVDYAYSLPGDANSKAIPVDREVQQNAVTALIAALNPSVLSVEPRIVELLVPASIRTAWANEEPSGYAGPVFDPLALAETSASMTVGAMLHPARSARLMNQGISDNQHPGLTLVLKPLRDLVVGYFGDQANSNDGAVKRRVATTIVNHLIELAANDDAREDVRAEVRLYLLQILKELRQQQTKNDRLQAETLWIADKIDKFLQRPDLDIQRTSEPSPPPGSPIGLR